MTPYRNELQKENDTGEWQNGVREKFEAGCTFNTVKDVLSEEVHVGSL